MWPPCTPIVRCEQPVWEGPLEGDLTLSVSGDTIDLVAVELALSRRRPRPALSRAEQRHAVRLILERGHGAGLVAECLGVSGSTADAMVREAHHDQ